MGAIIPVFLLFEVGYCVREAKKTPKARRAWLQSLKAGLLERVSGLERGACSQESSIIGSVGAAATAVTVTATIDRRHRMAAAAVAAAAVASASYIKPCRALLL